MSDEETIIRGGGIEVLVLKHSRNDGKTYWEIESFDWPWGGALYFNREDAIRDAREWIVDSVAETKNIDRKLARLFVELSEEDDGRATENGAEVPHLQEEEAR